VYYTVTTNNVPVISFDNIQINYSFLMSLVIIKNKIIDKKIEGVLSTSVVRGF